MGVVLLRCRDEGAQLPGGQRSIRPSPSAVSSPPSRRPGTQRPFTKMPSSTLANPASGGPGVFGENVINKPFPAATNSSGPVEIIMAAPYVNGGISVGSAIGTGGGLRNAASTV